MYNPFNTGMRILTLQDLDLNLNGIDSQTTLSDIDDDIDMKLANSVIPTNPEDRSAFFESITPKLPQNNFNIRTLTQEQINAMKNPDIWSYKI
jgi:hypothetical protein